jgi:uncharacterized repeat protein (TIGR03803 family)
MGVKKVSPSATTALIVVAFFLTTLTKASAGTEKVLANFPGAHGGLQPWAGLVSDAAGNFYGVTYYGGPNGKGEVFRVRYSAATGWSECTAYGFKGGKDGAAPYGGLIFDAAGNLYGTTSSGGFYGGGTAFKLTHTSGCNWTSSVLYQFGKGEDGNYPAAALVFDHSGSLYGTTQAGGTHGYGTVFKLQLTSGKWTEHVLHNFIGTDGSSPWASVTFDRAGNLYGTTATGGKYNYGVVFQLSPASGGRWIELVIHTFTGGADGSEPQAGVVFDSAGNLYSASVYGGTLSAGNIFKLTKQSNQSWKETVLYNFTGGADGASPWDTPILDSAGHLYGTAYEGGISFGTVFELSRTSHGWKETVLYTFHGGSTGRCPVGGLIRDSAGHLYGTALRGGVDNRGLVFEIMGAGASQ